MTIKQEDFTNRALALLLKSQGLSADYEQRGGRKKMDVVVDVEGLRVVLEAETGFHRKAQAIKDADARLRQKLTTVVFAVCYPDGVTEDNLASATLTWTLRSKAGEPSVDWSTGSVAQLAQTVPAGAAFPERRRRGGPATLRRPGRGGAKAQESGQTVARQGP